MALENKARLPIARGARVGETLYQYTDAGISLTLVVVGGIVAYGAYSYFKSGNTFEKQFKKNIGV